MKTKYRRLKEGEIILETDELKRDRREGGEGKWEPVRFPGVRYLPWFHLPMRRKVKP